MPKQVITVCDTVNLQIEAQVELDIKYLKPGQEPDPCTPNSSIPPYTALGRSDLMDLVAAYLVTDEMPAEAKGMSEGGLSDMLRRTNGMCRDEVRALWFDAVERGNRLIERYQSELSSQRESSRERPESAPTSSGSSSPGSTGGDS